MAHRVNHLTSILRILGIREAEKHVLPRSCHRHVFEVVPNGDPALRVSRFGKDILQMWQEPAKGLDGRCEGIRTVRCIFGVRFCVILLCWRDRLA
jgi:hypothetical protein